MIQTGTDTRTIWVEDGEEVYPCPCGETHRGDYALYDYSMHVCRHGDELWFMEDIGVLCSQCGGYVGYLAGC